MTEEHWWKSLEEHEYAPHYWLVFADWLEEQGDPRSPMARRFGEDEQLKPDYYESMTLPYTWWQLGGSYAGVGKELFEELTGGLLWGHFRNAKDYATAREAYADLLRAYVVVSSRSPSQVPAQEVS